MSEAYPILAGEVVTALGAGTDEVWRRMLEGSGGIRPLRRFAPGKFLTEVAAEVPLETESLLRAREPAPAAGRAWLFALAAARRALEACPAVDRPLRTGLVLSTTKGEIGAIERLVTHPADPVDAHHDPGAFARDLSAALGLAGPVLAVSNACASGLVAVAQGARLLRRGEADRVLVVGVDALGEFLLAGFSALNALSKGPCRPFDARRTGLSLGEGSAALMLARPECAGRPPEAVLRGWAITNDAHHITAPSRTGEGLIRALTQALAMAGLRPAEIDYINGHGTGTLYNDEMEAKAVRAVFGLPTPPVTSMKGYFGHTLGAAGVIETVLSLAALRARTVPASLGLNEPGVSEPITLPRAHLPLPRFDHFVTHKCGFGGMNAVLVISRGEGA